MEYLHGQFYEKQMSKLDLSGTGYFTFCGKIPTASESENTIITAIQNYFRHIGKPLRDDPRIRDESRNYLLRRVHWASEVILQDDALRPAFLLYMVICCKSNLVSGNEIKIPNQTKGPWYDVARRDFPKQRAAQLMLLAEFCEIFHLNHEDKIKNLDQFLFWQGKNIQSIDELNYWEKQLAGDYTRIPVVGFQLCCRDYVRDCLCPHFEDLSYTTGSKLHLGGYVDFWNENQEIIQKQARSLGKNYPTLINEYTKLWNDPHDYFYNGEQWLEQQMETNCQISLEGFQYSDEYDESELKRLILESEFRLCVCGKARSKLIKMCETTCDLDRALFAEYE